MVTTRRIAVSDDVHLEVTEAGNRGDPVVVLAHGFPELAYSWRHQIPVLAAAGYHVLAPDQRGYGGSSQPSAITDYDIVSLCGDIVAILDDVDAERGVIVGHDWGSIVAWNAPLIYPDRFAGVVGLSGPPTPRPSAPPTETWRRRFGDTYFYMQFFQEPGVADADLSRDIASLLRRLLGAGATGERSALAAVFGPGPDSYADRLPEVDTLPHWLSQSELDHYTEVFTRTGFTGALNWYRNFDRNWKLSADFPASTIAVPSLFIAGSADLALGFNSSKRVREVVTGPYREVIVEGAGHWIQQERPDEINAHLLEFLSAV
jgi:pimeloyl-ACP methyl ester carboxylesterase